MEAPSIDSRRRERSWRTSLYARAALFLVLGGGSVMGAIVLVSAFMVEESVDRLLGERSDLARTSGALVEHAIQTDLKRLGDRAAPHLAPVDATGVRGALDREYRSTVFQEGAFVLDADGSPVASVPSGPPDLGGQVDLERLATEARARDRTIASPLVRLPRTGKPVLVLIVPVKSPVGRVVGFSGGVLQPAATNVLEVLALARPDAETGFDLVDSRGVVVASTDRGVLFQTGDHDSVLTRALQDRRELRVRCHSCHAGPEGAEARETEIMAFVPLPTIDLGLAVHQPEKEALEPAFALRRRLYMVGLAFVGMFWLFAGLSVHSVVRPVTSLTRAVRQAEGSTEPSPLPAFGDDEIGALAGAIEMWRARTQASLRAEEEHRQALHNEVEATRRHLASLQDIAVQSTLGADLGAIVALGIERLLFLLELDAGVLRVTDGVRSFVARRHLDESDAERILELCEVPAAPPAAGDDASSHRLRFFDLRESAAAAGLTVSRTLEGCRLDAPHGLALTCVVGDPDPGRRVERRWLQSIVHHIAMTATNRLLRDRDLDREQQRQKYLHRVLKAQEDERRRVARELHDTLAQDLAALRLRAERLARRAVDPALHEELAQLEEQAHSMLGGVRQILLDLRLPLLENLGFLPILQWQLERVERERGIRCVLSVDGEERDVGYDVAVPLFRIVQESIGNAVQHSGAEHIFVTVSFQSGAIELVVEDDGAGFDRDAVLGRAPGAEGRGLGILGMDERARILGGSLDISSEEGEGTVVTVSVPLPMHPEAPP